MQLIYISERANFFCCCSPYLNEFVLTVILFCRIGMLGKLIKLNGLRIMGEFVVPYTTAINFVPMFIGMLFVFVICRKFIIIYFKRNICEINKSSVTNLDDKTGRKSGRHNLNSCFFPRARVLFLHTLMIFSASLTSICFEFGLYRNRKVDRI